MTDDLKALRAENDHLRATLANSGGPCAYCDLPQDRWTECASGFPGCSRYDDAMLCPNVGAWLEKQEEVDRLTAERDEARTALAESERKAITLDDIRGSMWRLQYERRVGDELWPAILKARDQRLASTHSQETPDVQD